MYSSEFWTVLIAIVLFLLGVIGGMVVDYKTERRAAKKEYYKLLEEQNELLKRKISFYEFLSEERNEGQGM